MNLKQKTALCAFGASVLLWVGANASGLCGGLPAPYNLVCLGGAKAAQAGGEHVMRNLPDAGTDAP